MSMIGSLRIQPGDAPSGTRVYSVGGTKEVIVMADVSLVAAGLLLATAFIFGMSRRSDRTVVTGVLDRTAVREDRSRPVPPAFSAGTQPSGRDVERMAAAVRRPAPAVMTRPSPSAPRVVDDEALGVTRRQFLNRSILGLFGLSLAGFGTSVVGFLWPTLSGGFGSKVSAGSLTDVRSKMGAAKAPVYIPEARSYLNPYPAVNVGNAKKSGAYADPILAGMELGLVAIYQKCPHLGCRVPWCQSSQWFECPCHGSQYNRVGEKKGGPAPRGMDRFALTIANSQVVIDTKTVFLGPPIGTNTTGQEAEGPHCH